MKKVTMKANNHICVYIHINKLTKEVFYVGIGNIERPYLKTCRSKYWLEYIKYNEYEIDIIHTDLSWEKAIEKEKMLIKAIGRKDKGFGSLLNRTNGGEGRQYKNKWLKEELINEALKYKSREEFHLNSTGAYRAACRLGILNDICTHMFSFPGKNIFKLTKENCYNVAINFNQKYELMKAKKSIYNKIIRMGWQDYCFSHMTKMVDKKPYINIKFINEQKKHFSEITLGFTNLKNFIKNCKHMYKLIIKNGWESEFLSHMN